MFAYCLTGVDENCVPIGGALIPRATDNEGQPVWLHTQTLSKSWAMSTDGLTHIKQG